MSTPAPWENDCSKVKQLHRNGLQTHQRETPFPPWARVHGKEARRIALAGTPLIASKPEAQITRSGGSHGAPGRGPCGGSWGLLPTASTNLPGLRVSLFRRGSFPQSGLPMQGPVMNDRVCQLNQIPLDESQSMKQIPTVLKLEEEDTLIYWAAKTRGLLKRGLFSWPRTQMHRQGYILS